MDLKQISFSENSDSESEYNLNDDAFANGASHIDFRLNIDEAKRPQLELDSAFANHLIQKFDA